VIGTTLNRRFSLDKELGRGGMGAVYRATDLVLERPVAIKILKERAGESVGRAIRLEAQILARLVHEHIVRIYDFGESDGLYYFVMEEVDGSSFQKRGRSLDLPGRLRVIAQVAEALDYAHRQGVVHRDVKPANVLLTLADSARLSDFGLSVLLDSSTQESGMIRGTPHYMSPEQAKGRRLDHRTDLYSLGVVMYEAATGATPFAGPSLAVIASHAGATPEPPRSRNPAIAPALEALILGLMAKAPEVRPPSGAVVAAAIRALLADEPSLSAAAGRPASAGTGAWRGPSSEVAGGETSATRLVAHGTAGPGAAPAASGRPAGDLAAAPASLKSGAGTPGPAGRLLEEVLAEPIALSADERYLAGHYLAYLLGGSRRKGFLRRRPLDPLNADRARLLLAMAWLTTRPGGPAGGAVEAAAMVLESRSDVRPSLSPVAIAKYLSARDTPAKRRAFRAARRLLQEASPSAAARLTDDRGVLNPGLMPQVLDDLRTIAPARTEVDDLLVERWNRVADVWRERPDFRRAVLGYATTGAAADPASASLWPEVVYPLIERARWQRRLRSTPELLWDQVLGAFHLPDAGNKLDRAIREVVPTRVVAELDQELAAFADEPELAAFADEPHRDRDSAVLSVGPGVGASGLYDEVDGPARDRGLVRLVRPDPIRLTLGELKALYGEGVAAMRAPGGKAGHRHVPVGPYRLAVIPSIRGRSAGQVVIQGMTNKQVEMLTPSLRMAGSSGRPIVAAWVYEDDSLAIAYLDFRNAPQYITWHAPTAHQDNYDDPAGLNHALYSLGLEVPDGLAEALSKRFRPRNPA